VTGTLAAIETAIITSIALSAGAAADISGAGTLARIYLSEIETWDDEASVTLNQAGYPACLPARSTHCFQVAGLRCPE